MKNNQNTPLLFIRYYGIMSVEKRGIGPRETNEKGNGK